MPSQSDNLKKHPVVSRQDWLAARTAFLDLEKAFTRQRDEINRLRRELPWVKVDKEYFFETPAGRKSLAQLFGRHSQLAIYHFMFAPDWEQGCPHCSFWADNFNGIPVHLGQRDLAFTAVSRAPLPKIEAFKKRMGWSFPWVSSGEDDFNYDHQASFRPGDVARKKIFYNFKDLNAGMTDREGVSVFIKGPDGDIFHSYSTYARGIDLLNGAYNFLDLVPKGRDEDENPDWLDFHDRYKE